MPATIAMTKQRDFNQSYLTNAAKDTAFQQRILSADNMHTPYPGYCFGFSTVFAHNFITGKTEQFCDDYTEFSRSPTCLFRPSQIHSFIRLPVKKRKNLNEYEAIFKNEISKKHISELLKDVMSTQVLYTRTVEHINKKNSIDKLNDFNEKIIISPLNKFLSMIEKKQDNVHSYTLHSQNHALAIGIDKSSGTYTFFDPNIAVFEFGKFSELKKFVISFVKDKKEIYNFIEDSTKSDYIIRYTEVQKQPNKSKKHSEMEKKKELQIKNQILVDDKFNIFKWDVTKFISSTITYTEFNEKNNLITLEIYSIDNSKHKIYSNQIDPEKLKKIVDSHDLELIQMKHSVFIDKSGNVYEVKNDQVMKKFTQSSNIENIFGKPIIISTPDTFN